MYPQIHLNYPGIAAAVVASFLFGWLWYGPLFGKKWAALMNMAMDHQLGKAGAGACSGSTPPITS